MARLNIMELNDPSTVLAPDSATEWDRLLSEILLPEVDVRYSPRRERKIADVDQLLAHIIARRDVFVTGNTKDFKLSRIQRLAAVGVIVMTPSDVLAMLGREPESTSRTAYRARRWSLARWWRRCRSC